MLDCLTEYEPGVDEYGMPVYWSKITKERSVVPVLDIGVVMDRGITLTAYANPEVDQVRGALWLLTCSVAYL